MEVIPADDDGLVHLSGHHDALEDTATDGHVASERALLIHVAAALGQLGGLETQTHRLAPSEAL